MEQWKQHIMLGNQCFDERQLLTAMTHYQSAKSRAHVLFEHWFNPEQSVAALVVSYHNLADLYLREDNPAMAEKELRSIYDYILTQLDKDLPDVKRKRALLHGLKQSYTALLSNLQRYNIKGGAAPPDYIPQPKYLTEAYNNDRSTF